MKHNLNSECLNYFKEHYTEMLNDVSAVSLDTTLKRADRILNFFEKELSSIHHLYSDSSKIYAKTLLFLLNIYDGKKEYDSVQHYYEKIENNLLDPEVLGNAALYKANEKLFKKKYFESIRSLQKALDYFKSIHATDKEIVTYLKLSKIYKKIKSTALYKEADAVLMNHYLPKPISALLKSQILINHASYIAFIGDTDAAINVLKTLNVDDFNSDARILKEYYTAFKRCYLKSNQTDSARVYINKIRELKSVAQPEDKAIENIYLAIIALKEQNYKQALRYVEIAQNDSAFTYVAQSEVLKLHRVVYMSHKALGNYKKAFKALENFHSIRDSIKSFNLNLNAAILNFKLNQNRKIKELHEINAMNTVKMEGNKKFYIFSTLLISASVLILIFLIILHKRKKKRLKLQYENEKMKEVAVIKNNFIENLSHEIRTPITITLGYLRLITKTMDYSKIVEYANLTIRNNEQIVTMLDNFLSLLKQDKNPIESRKTSKKMEVFLRESTFAFQGVAEIKGVYLYYKSNIKTDQEIEFHYDDLHKIINNIMSNALKYTSPTYGIYVHTFIDKKGLNIIVKDEGIGIDKKEQKLIFNRFYQTKNNLTNGGFGIGLSLVYELVTKLNGTIKLDSKKNVGSVFTIQLPLTVENTLLYIDEKKQEYQSISKPEITIPDEKNNLPQVLIVDDNIEMIGYLKDLLEPSLTCTFAFDGAQALAFAKKKQYDLILTDLRMPLLDGYQLKAELQQLKNYENTPFIVMTSSAKEYLEHKKEEYGINDYLIKPFDSIELLTRINYHLEKNIYKKQLQSLENELITFNGPHAEFMEKVNAIILENINKKEFTIHKLAKQCGYSHKQFTKIVQNKTGMTPVKVILEVRLRKAYELIVTKQYQSINEVLYAVGLNSRSYFNKVFQKRFGVKPGKLIKKLKTKVVVQ
ncbi:ATP-binding protein [Kordia periserrulae]|nr:ATP-binding protein [Kordia periserrulae]